MTESTDIATQGGMTPEVLEEMRQASAAAKGEIDLQQDVRLPALQLMQATTQTDVEAKPGQIIDTLTGEAVDDVEVIPVALYKTRAYFGSGTIGDPPTCNSPDALNGYGEVADELKAKGVTGPAGDSGACLRCPQADWRRGGKCQLRFNYLVLIPGEDVARTVPRVLMMHGTSAKTASRLNTMLYEHELLWGQTLKLSSKEEKNDRGKYRVWQVARGRPSDDAEMLAAFRTNQQFEKQRREGARVSVEGEEPAASAASEGGDDIPF